MDAPPISIPERKWRALIKLARYHAENPARDAADLNLAAQDILKVVWPVTRTVASENLWGALVRLCRAFATHPLKARMALGPSLNGLAAFCLAQLDGPDPETVAAQVDLFSPPPAAEPLPWLARKDIAG